MGRKRIAVLTFSEFVVILGVMGIFASLVIPSYIHIQRTSRIEHLLESARLCQEDLSLWLSTPVSNEPLEPGTGGEGGGEAVAGAPDPRGVLEESVRNRFERFQHKNLPGDEPLLVGTDEYRNGEPAYDGILAVNNVEPGTK